MKDDSASGDIDRSRRDQLSAEIAGSIA